MTHPITECMACKKAEILFGDHNSYYKFVAILEALDAKEEVKKFFYANLFVVCMGELKEVARKLPEKVCFYSVTRHYKKSSSNSSKRNGITIEDLVKENASVILSPFKEIALEKINDLWKKEGDCEWEITFYLAREFSNEKLGSLTFRSSTQTIEICSANSKIATSFQESFGEKFAKRNGVTIACGHGTASEVMKSRKEVEMRN